MTERGREKNTKKRGKDRQASHDTKTERETDRHRKWTEGLKQTLEGGREKNKHVKKRERKKMKQMHCQAGREERKKHIDKGESCINGREIGTVTSKKYKQKREC